MGEGEAFGVEEEAAELFDGAFDLGVGDSVVAAFIISGVADDGVIDRGEVDSDLVRPAGLDVDVEQCEFLEPLTHFPDRQCVSAICGDGHLRPVPAVAGDGPIDGAFAFPRAAVDESDVGFFYCAVAELFGEGIVSLVVLGNEDESGCVFVEPVDDADAVRTACVSGRPVR